MQQEKSTLESRLQAINRVLDGTAPRPSIAPARRGRPPKAKTIADEKPRKRKMSAAARAAISASAKARWRNGKPRARIVVECNPIPVRDLVGIP